MKIMKNYYKEPWFGKKKTDWGIRPISWHGWLASLIFLLFLVGLSILSLINYRYAYQIEAFQLVITLLFVLLVYSTRDKS